MQLAVALDKVRNDHSLLVWDVESRPSKYGVPKRLYFVYIVPVEQLQFVWPVFSGVEKVSDHGTIGPRKYFGSQKEADQT